MSDGLSIDVEGNVYITDVEHNAIFVVGEDRELQTLLRSPRIRWPDALSFGPNGWLYVADSALQDVVLTACFALAPGPKACPGNSLQIPLLYAAVVLIRDSARSATPHSPGTVAGTVPVGGRFGLAALLISTAFAGYRWTIPAVIGMLLTLVGKRLILSRRKNNQQHKGTP